MNTPSPDALTLASIPILRYPRTQHLEGSRLQPDDDRVQVPLRTLQGAHVVVEEKLDGANAGVSFTRGGDLLLQSRGHYLAGGARERQFAPFHVWARAHEALLLERLEDRYVMYGEWTYSKHSCWYDQLPAHFHEFDVWDRRQQCFLSTEARLRLLAGLPVLSVPVLYRGPMPQRLELLWALVRSSLARSEGWREAFERAVARAGLDPELSRRQTDWDDRAEGLYVKVEEGDRVVGRYKLVRANFTQAILDSGSHHAARPILPNGLHPQVDLYAPELQVTWEDLGLRTVEGLDALQQLLASQRPNGRRTS
jgi:hypothetical protein